MPLTLSSANGSPVENHFYHHPGPFTFRSGQMLPGFTLAYEMWGEINADASNVILLFHALSGSQHASGYNPAVSETDARWTEDLHHGWWSDFIGPGKALDTNKYCVICANFIGGCYGSSGPASLNPATGKPWGSSFPHVSVSDIVRTQMLLLDSLGVSTLHAAIGPSIGGLCALALSTLFPERVRLIVQIASGCQTTVLNRLFLFEQILAIENDPNFNGGDFYEGAPPLYGLALARMVSHKTFVHLDEIETRARGEVKQPGEGLAWYRLRDNIESYMLHQGKKFVTRFDANTYLRICEAWSSFDPVKEGQALSWTELLAPVRKNNHQFLVFSIDSDFCFYPEEQSALVRHLREAEVNVMHITVHSLKGHDSFLLEPLLYTPHLAYALEAARAVPA
ncbi:MAG: homoserine O-acetyltransferase [Verrucomicrobiota bacterium]